MLTSYSGANTREPSLEESMNDAASITRLLIDWSNGNQAALDELTPRVQPELHAIGFRCED